MSFWTFLLIYLSVIFVYSKISGKLHNNKLIKMSLDRGEISKDEFVNNLIQDGFDEKWISKLYDVIIDYVPRKNFTMSPDDRLVTDYHIDKEDLEDITLKLFEEKNGYVVSQEEIDKAETKGASILTFKGILIYIHSPT